jgi:hypothetical protein
VGTKEKPKDGVENMFVACNRPTDLTANMILLASFLTRYGCGSKYFFDINRDNFAVAKDLFRPNDGMGVLIRSKSAQECRPPPWNTPDHVITNTRTNFTRGAIEQNVVRRRGLTGNRHRQMIRPVL